MILANSVGFFARGFVRRVGWEEDWGPWPVELSVCLIVKCGL